jgi:hypothetical protein
MCMCMYGRPSDITDRRSEALIRIGSIGAAELADDDDVVLIIAPQNGMYALRNTMHEIMMIFFLSHELCHPYILYPQ